MEEACCKEEAEAEAEIPDRVNYCLKTKQRQERGIEIREAQGIAFIRTGDCLEIPTSKTLQSAWSFSGPHSPYRLQP